MHRPVLELFAEIIHWAASQGAENLPAHPGLWNGSTEDWDVSINGHGEVIDDVPPMTAKLVHRRLMSVALVDPFGGIVAAGNEDEMIAHFRERAAAGLGR